MFQQIELSRFTGVSVLCVGDLMLDRFVHGSVRRVSPERPVPVMLFGNEAVAMGGAANVAANIVALGASCTLVGITGQDEAGAQLAKLAASLRNLRLQSISSPRHPTIEKIRFVSQGQHMLRVDREGDAMLDAALEDRIIHAVAGELPNHRVVVLSDYAKGVLSERVVREIITQCAARSIPVVVDPKSPDLRKYAGATIITPNRAETLLASGVEVADDASAQRAAEQMLAKTSLQSVLITRAEQGMTLLERQGEPRHFRAHSREVFDVVGAGDTVVATLAVALGASWTLADAAMVANAAAGIVVAKEGTATVTQTELLDELNGFAMTIQQQYDSKLLDLQAARTLCETWRRDSKSIGFTNGCFDILHAGHIRLLEFARSKCDRLVVGLNSDASVRRLKGATRPVNSQLDRAAVLAALGVVDLVIMFEADTPLTLIETLAPDVLVKGADYKVSEIVGADLVLKKGGRVLTCELLPGRSTTHTIAGVQQEQDRPAP